MRFTIRRIARGAGVLPLSGRLLADSLAIAARAREFELAARRKGCVIIRQHFGQEQPTISTKYRRWLAAGGRQRMDEQKREAFRQGALRMWAQRRLRESA